jgi:hypothetical protein
VSKLKSKVKQRIEEKKRIKKEQSGKSCSLKALGQYSSAAKCDVPKQCMTCSWFQPTEQIKQKKASIDRWKKHGF